MSKIQKGSKKYTAEFEKKHSFEVRVTESRKILDKYPDRIPVVVEKLPINSILPDIHKNKFLVPSDLTIAQFLYVIRRYLRMESANSIYLFCHDNIPATSASIATLYDNYKEADGFLYIFYTGDNTFG